MEEAQKKKKQQAIRMALTEILMALSVICLTVFLTMLVLGYNIGSGWKIERSGLVQIDSLPTGAKVAVDGEEEVLLRTNLSKSYPSGQHTVVLSKDGYDTWQKDINVTEGYYYRLSYPRLFLKEIKKEKVLDFDGLVYLAKSPVEDVILVKNVESGQLELINLSGAKAVVNVLKGSETILGGKEVEVKEWSKSGDKVLVKVADEWMVIDLKNMDESVNLTKMFDVVFSEVKFENESASKILVVVNGGLREISLEDAKMSKTLVDKIEKFANDGENIMYVTLPDANKERVVGVYKEGEKAGTKIKEIANSEAAVNMAIGNYYEDDFLAVTIGNELLVYQGEVPSYGEKAKKLVLIIEKELGFVPTSLDMKGKNELIMARDGAKVAVMDAEAFSVVEYEMVNAAAGWLDEFMFYAIEDGKVVVWDFDGLNKRSLVEEAQGGIVVLSKNGKWLYYLNDKGVLTGAKVS